MMVLIADDSEVVAERLEAMLSEVPGVEIVGQARDAPEATKSILELQPDVVILDIRMPTGSGIEVLRNIKQRDHAPAVIMLTNYHYPQYRKRCLDAGADFFFDKASDFHKVVEVLKQMAQDSS
jgi:DNA-binding NarL/FixJ family response regulator